MGKRTSLKKTKTCSKYCVYLCVSFDINLKLPISYTKGQHKIVTYKALNRAVAKFLYPRNNPVDGSKHREDVGSDSRVDDRSTRGLEGTVREIVDQKFLAHRCTHKIW